MDNDDILNLRVTLLLQSLQMCIDDRGARVLPNRIAKRRRLC
jgi:hypothetical protein